MLAPLILLLAGSGAATAEACDGGDEALASALGEALGAWGSMRADTYERARSAVDACMERLNAPASPQLAASWLRYQGVDAWYRSQDAESTRDWFASAALADPAFDPAGTALDANPLTARLYAEARTRPASNIEALPQDPALRLWVNGAPTGQRPADLPVLLQIESPTLGVLQTRTLAPGQSLDLESVPSVSAARAAHSHQLELGARLMKAGAFTLSGAALVEGGLWFGLARAASHGEGDLSVTNLTRVGFLGQAAAGSLAGAGALAIGLGLSLR